MGTLQHIIIFFFYFVYAACPTLADGGKLSAPLPV
jgi:hypothetical protein